MANLVETLKQRAFEEGFDAIRVAPAQGDPQLAARLKHFIAMGYHGEMDWLEETAPRRERPTAMWPEAKSAIMLALNYGPALDPMARLAERSTGVISVYALGRDYHAMMKGKLKRLAQWLEHRAKTKVKVFVDTAPLMEKPLAAQAGLGWQGKHTNLVSRELGSWFFIGAILTTAELPYDVPESDHCGTCRACLDICPTKAFPTPYQLDARRCISYLTIEHAGHIAREFRAAMGNRIFGCDDCLAVCPWNKYARSATEIKLQARNDLVAPSLSDFLQLDEVAFRKKFSVSPLKRIGHTRFLRNVLIAAGNSSDETMLPHVERHLRHASPLVRAMAVWALSRLASREHFARLKAQKFPGEPDKIVKSEWATS